MPSRLLTTRLRAALLIALTLGSSAVAAADSRVKRLVACPEAFEPSDVSFALDLAIDAPRTSADPTVRYRLRVLAPEADCRWDSGWLSPVASPARRLRPQPLHLAADLDPALAQIWVEITLEVDGRLEPATRFPFFRWADGRFRAFPEPLSWPESLQPSLRDTPPPTPRPVFRVQPRQQIIILAQPRSSLPRLSWGHFKAKYR